MGREALRLPWAGGGGAWPGRERRCGQAALQVLWPAYEAAGPDCGGWAHISPPPAHPPLTFHGALWMEGACQDRPSQTKGLGGWGALGNATAPRASVSGTKKALGVSAQGSWGEPPTMDSRAETRWRGVSFPAALRSARHTHTHTPAPAEGRGLHHGFAQAKGRVRRHSDTGKRVLFTVVLLFQPSEKAGNPIRGTLPPPWTH